MNELVIVQAPTLQIVQEQSYIHFNAATLVGPPGASSITLVPFLFTATAGQTVFNLASTPATGVILLAINGAVQSEAGGDFTVVGSTVTLAEGVDLNDKVFGIYA